MLNRVEKTFKMDEICEIVPSQKENNKINVCGYLMVQDKIHKNIYYWCRDDDFLR